MRSSFHVSATIDDENKLIIFRIIGEIDSPRLINKWIATYSEIAEPWRYQRLFDYRRSSGIVEFEDLIHFSEWWHDRTQGVDYLSKVAVIVNNPLDQVRVNVVANLFPRDIRQSFTTLDEALGWLNGEEIAPTASRTASA